MIDLNVKRVFLYIHSAQPKSEIVQLLQTKYKTYI